jgi:hypothetical protein
MTPRSLIIRGVKARRPGTAVVAEDFRLSESRGNHMRHRLLVVAATAIALSIPASVAVVGTSAPAFAASTISCTSLKGTATGTVTIGKCTPKSKTNKSASGAAASLVSGGTITWTPSNQTTVTKLTVTSPGQGGCKKNNTEEDAKGTVTGGTSTYTHSGDVVSIRACFNSQTGALSLVKGSVALL